MQLDRTEIVIRQRTTAELLDLSLRVLRHHALPLAKAMALLGIPLLILDLLLLAWMLREDAMLVSEAADDPATYLKIRHAVHLIALFTIQFPLASLPATLLLGSLAFYEPLPLRLMLRRLTKVAWSTLWVLGFCRFGIVVLFMELMINRNTSFDPWVELSLLLVLGWTMLIRSGWPFSGEILGLEQCPLRVKPNSRSVAYVNRRTGLHDASGADHVMRFIVCVFVVVGLALLLLVAFVMAASMVTEQFFWNKWTAQLVLPIVLWSVSLFAVVFRFLSYLDSRIRMEGWEIELRLRAEGRRVQEAMVANNPTTAEIRPRVTT